MKKIFIRLSVFALVILACDWLAGMAGDYLVHHAIGGDTKRKCQIAYHTSEYMLIFGSSRAFHHYDPEIMENGLGVTCYNCGFDGNGIICAYGFYKMIIERYHPKAIVYDVIPNFDLLDGDNHKYLGNLRYFYDEQSIDSIFSSVDYTENYKMMSRMYQYTSMFPQLIMDNVYPLHGDKKGYRPLEGEMQYDIEKSGNIPDYKFDELKLYYLERLITACKNNETTLIFTASPLYGNTDDTVLQPIKRLCEKHGTPFINHYTDSAYNFKKKYFKDSTHLNEKGATVYTEQIVKEIKAILKERI